MFKWCLVFFPLFSYAVFVGNPMQILLHQDHWSLRCGYVHEHNYRTRYEDIPVGTYRVVQAVIGVPDGNPVARFVGRDLGDGVEHSIRCGAGVQGRRIGPRGAGIDRT